MKVQVAPHETHFARFLTEHSSSLLITAYLLTRERDAAEDLLQDVLVTLYGQWHRVIDADNELAYVRRALLNRFLNRRRKKSSTEIVTELPPEPRSAPDFANQLVDRDQLRRALGVLPDRTRAAIVLRYFHDLPDAEIAQLLGCREGTVRSLVSRGLASLRARVGDGTGEGSPSRGSAFGQERGA